MQFTFKRDEEGRERIYVGDVCVAHVGANDRFNVQWQPVTHYTNVTSEMMDDAIERADEAGFWHEGDYPYGGKWTYLQVTVDVPVADNAVMSVTVGGDES